MYAVQKNGLGREVHTEYKGVEIMKEDIMRYIEFENSLRFM